MSEVKSDTPITDEIIDSVIKQGLDESVRCAVLIGSLSCRCKKFEIALTEARKNAARYEKVKLMNSAKFRMLAIENELTGVEFDQLVDEWEPTK